MINDTARVRSLLDQVKAITIKHSGLALREQYDFNVFAIVRGPREEVGLHSTFLYALLSPSGGHGQGAWFLNRFLEQAGLEPMPDGRQVQVYREYTKCRTDSAGDKRKDSIDIFIKAGDRAVIIENKIEAGDQEKQLCRYVRLAMGEGLDFGKVDVIYLSPDGHAPDCGPEEFEGVNYVPARNDYDCPRLRFGDAEKEIKLMSYAADIIDWLDTCIARMATYPTTRETLVLYQRIVKQLTGQSMNEEERMEIANKIIESEDQFSLAKKIVDAMPKAMEEVQRRFWQEMREEANACSLPSPVGNDRYWGNRISNYYTNKKNVTPYGLEFTLGTVAGTPVVFFLYLEHNLYYGLRLDDDLHDADFEKIVASMGYAKNGTYWRYPWNEASNAYDLKITFKNFDGFAMNLVDESFRKNYVSQLAREIEKAYQEAQDILKQEGILAE